MRLPHLSANLIKQGQLTKRLQAWWAGYHYEAEDDALPEPEEAPDAVERASGFNSRQSAAWSDPRLQVSEKIWGTGYSGPGGDDEVEALIRPLALDSSMAIVNFGAGLGGTTRALHNQTGAWVSGYEPSPLLAEAGAELSQSAGLHKKATIEAFDVETLNLHDDGFNAVFSKEALFAMGQKQGIFEKFYNCLRVDGQLLITDYLATKPDGSGDAIEQWAAQESARPKLWSLEQTCAVISDLGFKVRITEDVTPSVRKQILIALAAFSGSIDPNSPSQSGRGPAIIAEIEMWANRIKVLDSGEVAVFRIYGRKFDPKLK